LAKFPTGRDVLTERRATKGGAGSGKSETKFGKVEGGGG